MSDLKAQFEQAQKDVRKLTKKPSDNDLLALYSLFKQATEGDVSGPRPGMLNVVARAKYDAWAKLKGTKNDAAMKQYIAKVEELQKKLG
ncbi:MULTISPECIES: acyl-CoA-binding protein [Hydrocarboniphaga]|uniref:Acyl-CoA-binding protein n=1 Tax=Hydrocarboniphaga effusa AP103 TaxID=1172194 RepID=I8I087_9GAMM|nr:MULTISPECIES: acyl-CoA-binding protein [Hydrocarboniphaga]EIT69381.1 acyl-CoA-binding protein [Hydrocarboniphaga effusa AP103]MDZ4080480.1 acyl-CoA-binding protein [Hydrocarboniphaga sp.]